jgi:hypothetical protein
MPLPKFFCWTRFGTEAGQLANHILERKEQERVANGGTFLWGIGNAIGPSMREFLQLTQDPEVLFSPIKSIPRREDAAPSSVVVWTSATTLLGNPFPLPDCSLITSRYDPMSPKIAHYALVCFSGTPLAASKSDEQIAFAGLRNLLTGRPVGASQVTAIVQAKRSEPEGRHLYDVAIRAKLVPPYFLRLLDPLPLSLADAKDGWAPAVRRVWDQRRTIASH